MGCGRHCAGIQRAFVDGPLAADLERDPLWVISHQDLAESWVESLDVFGKLFTVFEVKLLLAALLGRAGTRVGVRRGIAKNGSSELLVDEVGTPALTAASKLSYITCLVAAIS